MPRKKEAGKVGGRDAHTKKASTTKEKRNQKKKITEQVKKVAQSIKTEKNVKGGKVTIKPMAASSTGKSVVLTELLLDDKWKKSLSAEFDQPYFKTLQDTLASEYKQGKEIFPPVDLIFNALHLTPLDKVKVVILGQDPYHDNGQAMGLSFSVPKGITVPPSLRNMYKELERDTKIKGFIKPDHGNLEAWAKQGVLLLNATLTVEAHQPNSHAKFGWQKFTDGIIKVVSEECKHVVFILWGGFAHKKEKLIDSTKHQVIKTAHPSPLSFNKFNGCNCFSDCNSALTKLGVSPIDWSL